jgi:hypothetical protein
MGFTSIIRSAAHAIGRTADKFTPWYGDIERAAAHGAAIERIRGEAHRDSPPDPHQVDEQYWPAPGAVPCANPEHAHTEGSTPRTMTDITRDYYGELDAAPDYVTEQEIGAAAEAWEGTVRDQDGELTRLTGGQQASRDAYALMDLGERVAYLGDRAAEMAAAGDVPNAVTARMVLDGVAPDDVRQVVATAGEWATSAEAQEEAFEDEARDREHAGPSDLEAEQEPGGPLWNPETGQPYDEATTARLINEARFPEAEADNPFYDPPGSRWAGPTEEYLTVQAWADAHPDAESGEPEWDSQDSAAYPSREQQGDFAALPEDLQARYLGAPVPEDEPGWVADPRQLTDEQVDADNAARRQSDYAIEDAAEASWRGCLPSDSVRAAWEPGYGPALAEPEWDSADSSAYQDAAGHGSDEPVPYELTELGGYQAVADQMTEREVGPGFMGAPAAEDAGLRDLDRQAGADWEAGS